MMNTEAEILARRKRISEEITLALRKTGYSKKEFAARMGRLPSEVTKWLSGTHNFTSDLLAEISCVLGQPISGADDPDTLALRDSGTYSVSSIDLPPDIMLTLKRKAVAKGTTLIEYVTDLLRKEADRKEVSVMDFCGIWDDSYPTAEEIRVARTENTFTEL